MATAPYNFVPLPRAVLRVENDPRFREVHGRPLWECHDRFVEGRHSGSIHLRIRTLTPLFIRGSRRRRADGDWDTRAARLRPDPAMLPDGRPIIPGSSLRGAIRTLVEILSFSAIGSVTNQRPFFRSVADDRIGRHYRDRVVKDQEKPRGGFLRRGRAGWEVEPADVVRVSHALLTACGFRYEQRPDYSPNWRLQHRRCWVRLAREGTRVEELRLEDPGGRGWRMATLVLTGSAPKKKGEFVFLDPDPQGERVPVGDAVIRRFHDEDQLTQWQEKAFPKGKPEGGGRPRAGHLREGEPVFWLLDESGGVEFLGRAQMFRLPYSRSPRDLVPEDLRGDGLDLADVLFGTVGASTAVKGRVRVGEAVARGAGPWLEDEVLVPKILSSPKVTCFQHYLTQDGDAGTEQLTTYLPDDCTTIRGHKLYWHRWDEASGLAEVRDSNNDRLRADLESENPTDTQHTIMRPVRADVEFEGRLDFENLNDIELGALLTALQLPEGCAHKLGMGKPLGLGSVRIEARLELIDRSRRYSRWADTGEVGDPLEDGSRISARCRGAFTEAILDHATRVGETIIPTEEGLRRIARLDALFTILDWERRPGPRQTAYLPDPKAFAKRAVLPSPHAVAGRPEPDWQGPRPRPGPCSGDGGQGAGRADSSRRHTVGGRQKTAAAASGTLPARRGPGTQPSGLEKGATVTAIASGRTKKGGWRFRIEGYDREADIHPQDADKLPPDLAEGMSLTLVVDFVSRDQVRLRLPSAS